MFLRIVTTKYKNNEYHYLKLLESYRSGEKIRQRVLMNIANLDRMPVSKAKALAEELHDELNYCKTLRAFSATGAKYCKISYIFAIERAFKPLKGCSDSEIRDICLNEKIKARYSVNDREQFYNLIHKKTIEAGSAPGVLFWARKLNSIFSSPDENIYLGLLLNSRGLPLRYTIFRQQPGENKIRDILDEANRAYQCSWTLALICEDTYQNLTADQPADHFEQSHISEVFMHRQVTNWLGHANFTTDRYILINQIQHDNDQVTRAINQLNDFVDYLNWVIGRVEGVTKEGIQSLKEVLDITFISYLFYKQTLRILEKHNLSLAGSKTKFLHEVTETNTISPDDELF